MTIKPVYVGEINGVPVRFFKTPLNDGRPDLPWVSIDDLAKACKLSRNFRRELHKKLTSCPDDRSKAVAVGGEIIKIIPHCMAQGLNAAAVECGGVDISADYIMASKKAFDSLPFSYNIPRAAIPNYLVTAVSRWE